MPLTTPTAATKLARKSLAVRYQQLCTEIETLPAQLDRLVAQAAPELLAVKGVSTVTAACLLVTAGDNPERLRSEAAFAHLCGVAPIPASSGKTRRYRLNRGGDIARPTKRCTSWQSGGWAGTPPPAPPSLAERRRD